MEKKLQEYRLTVGEITIHYREVSAVLSAHGIDLEARAKLVGLHPQTMKQYGAGYGTQAWRMVSVEVLDTLRDAAEDAYWQAAADPYRLQVKSERGESYIVPSLIALCDSMMRERHPHPLRVLELADRYGGHVINIQRTPFKLELDEAAVLRSRWRKTARKISWPAQKGLVTARDFLCEAAGCCPYSRWKVGCEYPSWSIQPTTEMCERLEGMIAELEREAA